MSERPEEVKCAVEGCQIPVDIVLKSGDNLYVGAHKDNLQTFAEGIRGASETDTAIVLPENAATLELLMHFTHVDPQPYLDHLPFNLMSDLTDAAEKYVVRDAAQCCWLEMRARVDKEPLGVLYSAVKHNQRSFIDLAAPKTLKFSCRQAKDIIPDRDFLIRWVKYTDLWDSAVRSIAEIPLSPDDLSGRQGVDGGEPHHEELRAFEFMVCPRLYQFFAEVSTWVQGSGRSGLLSLDEDAIVRYAGKFLPKNCVECRAIVHDWLAAARTRIDELKAMEFPTAITTSAETPAVAGCPKGGKCPVQGCRLRVDIVLQSRDGIFIGAHTHNLEMYGEAFPEASAVTVPDAPVLFTEDGEVLKLLMRFMHLTPQPSLNNLDFKFLADFADAVQKYGVHSAAQVCHLKMSASAAEAPMWVLRYALKYNYPDLANIVAPHTLGYQPQVLETEHLLQWILYCERWDRALFFTVATPFDEDDYASRRRNRGKHAEWPVHAEGGWPVCESAHIVWGAVVNELLTQGRSVLLKLDEDIIKDHEHLFSEGARKCIRKI
ncbi:hypothetical protein BD626DRAFT_441304 [Schizophyllum amplum]|uniref:BTB domain-containing protein n=1 Tax=Schizophyllum amplum TaxID=97359 RepID=A0A550BUF5_9AGAR|nr:hypothetical protein BD626DRAFT_441304 [Auriculariopsis ampla]